MDPDATLADIEWTLREVRATEEPELRTLCLDLKRWLERRGFEPAWHKAPKATEYFARNYWRGGSMPASVWAK